MVASSARRTPATASHSLSTLGRRHPRSSVLVVAGLLVLAQLGFRAWAAYPAFFYSDDYRLVDEAGRAGLTLGQLMRPHDAQFMPFGRFVAWIGSVPDQMSWPLLATTSLLLQLLSALACLWMLASLFGLRWQILVPLSVYLTSAMTMPAFMWWAAALNQIPMQAVFFAAVAAWVHYMRGRQLRWLALVLLLLCLGLLCYVKTLFVFPVLAFLALGWFASGNPVRRVLTVARRYWPAVVGGVVGGAAFLAYYVLNVPQLADGEVPTGAGELADQMIGESLAAGVFGGPWRWNEQIAPAAQADSPQWTIHLCWLLAGLVVLYLALRRDRTLRAWALFAGYVGADYVLLLTTRAQAVGAVTGAEYRYLSDAVCALVLALGLATLPLLGATESSTPRAVPLLTRGIGRRTVLAATVLLALSGSWSSAAYARVWHDNNPGKTFFGVTLPSAAGVDRIDMTNQFLPIKITGSFGPPGNETEQVLPLLDPAFHFPSHTDALHVLADDGRVVAAQITEATASQPGPVPRCGWAVRDGGQLIPLTGPAIGVTWWLRIDYLSAQDSAVRFRAGGTEAELDVRRGLGTTFVRAEGPFDSVELDGLDPGVTLCVDRIVVGEPEPSAVPLSQEIR